MVTNAHHPFKAFGFKAEKEILDLVLNPAHRVEFVRFLFPDILGRPMDFTIPSVELAAAFKEGKGFDGSSVAGFVRIEESDLVIKPDPTTFRVLPWEYRGFDEAVRWREAVVFGDILTPEGEPYEGDSRAVLKRTMALARREYGFDDFRCGPELEFFIFPNDREPVPLDVGGYFFSGRHGEVRARSSSCSTDGCRNEYDHHEGPRQHEIDLRYQSALAMADTSMLFRYMVKGLPDARPPGPSCPSPSTARTGRMHVHQSLWKGRRTLLRPPGRHNLSETARRYMAGLIAHARRFPPSSASGSPISGSSRI
jgi:glutamine synthetase